MSSLERILILPDTQFPLNDEKLTDKLAWFIGEYKPDQLAHVGDLTDSTELGRWVEGARGQYSGGLEGGFAKTRKWLDKIRDVYDGPFHISRANHDDRLESKIERKMPEIVGLTIGGQRICIENALQFDDYNISYHRKYYELAPNWILGHGDYGTMSSVPGNTALLEAKVIGKSFVCGHTHRAGLAGARQESELGGVELIGMEVGHAMDRGMAHYLKAGKNNWHQAFGILRVHRGNKKKVRVYPEVVLVMDDYSFVVEGERF